jgi:glycosyltransferase involved in cell wall biosynthesis
MVDDLRQAGVPDERIRLIPNGVALPPDAADVAMNRDVLFIGNFTQGAQTKAFDILIEAWALATRAVPDGALHVLGAGDNAPWLRLARERGCADRIFFQGFVKDPSALFRHAAVFALPSRIEGLSNALLEAQSWGVPAVVSDIPGNRFVVQNGESGFVAPVGDAAAFADALIRLLRDAPLRARMGRRAREIISRQFGIDRVASQLEDLYTELRAGARETLSG